MHCGNKSVIAASKLVFHDRIKYIEIDCHITRQEYEKGRTILPYVPSGAELADLFTNAQISTQCHEILFKLLMFESP